MTMDDELTPEEIRKLYRPRIVDSTVERYISIFGGILIEGPKWSGKSWTGIRHSKSEIFLSKEENRKYAILDPEGALKGERPRLIDEWQQVTKLWDTARLKIDFSVNNGLYIFTGSTVPPETAVSHSGVGRFASLRMRTLSLYESGDSNGKISLSNMFDGNEINTVRSSLDYPEIIDLICRGGWPKAIGMKENVAIEIPRMYIKILSSSDISKVDGKKRNEELTRRLLLSLARNTATPASVNTLAKDISARGEQPSSATIIDYLGALKKLFMVEEQGGWDPNLRSVTRIQSSPRRHLTDPSLAAALLCGGPGELKQDPNTAGFLFESLCYRDLCVYAAPLGGEIYYYRDDDGLEVDFIIQLSDGRWGMAEAKMGYDEFDKAARNMIKVKNKMISAGAREPSVMMILNVTGGVAVKREDGIIEVPIDCLGP